MRIKSTKLLLRFSFNGEEKCTFLKIRFRSYVSPEFFFFENWTCQVVAPRPSITNRHGETLNTSRRINHRQRIPLMSYSWWVEVRETYVFHPKGGYLIEY